MKFSAITISLLLSILTDKYGSDVLLEKMLPILNQVTSFEEAFLTAFVVPVDEFYIVFDQFLELPWFEQKAILPQ